MFPPDETQPSKVDQLLADILRQPKRPVPLATPEEAEWAFKLSITLPYSFRMVRECLRMMNYNRDATIKLLTLCSEGGISDPQELLFQWFVVVNETEKAKQLRK